MGKAHRKDSSEDYVSDCSAQSDLTQATETAEIEPTYTAVKTSHYHPINSKNKIPAAKLVSVNNETDE